MFLRAYFEPSILLYNMDEIIILFWSILFFYLLVNQELFHYKIYIIILLFITFNCLLTHMQKSAQIVGIQYNELSQSELIHVTTLRSKK